MPNRKALLATVCLAAALACPRHGTGQYMEPPPPAAYALRNVTVMKADGTRMDSVNVVVRRGIVQALAAGAAIPPDAEVLEGEGLFVYPGLIDAEGTAEVTWPEPRDAVEDADSWAAPRSRQGFTPHRRVADHLSATGDDLTDARADGVVASMVHATGGMAAGQPSVIVNRATASAPWDLVAVASSGLDMSFQGAGGVYPSQLFGVIAFLRQAFLDAERHEARAAAYASDPTGLVPPSWDPDYEALRRAARGEVPVFFHADGSEDIRRVLNLQDEVGFRPVIVGGSEAWRVAEELADRGVPVLVSTDFPEPDDWDPESDDEELDPSAAREREEIEAVWSNAGKLEAAGVTFAFTSGGGDGDLLEGARKAVEHGLSPEGALRALTTTPATLLGVPTLTRIDAGLAATFLVADGELLADETSVVYTFVEGDLERGGEGGGGDEEPAADLSGEWEAELSAEGFSTEATLTITQDDEGGLAGTIVGPELPPSDFTGSISGRDVELRIQPEDLPEPIVLRGTLSEDGNEIRGGGSTPFGEVTFTARRGGGR